VIGSAATPSRALQTGKEKSRQENRQHRFVSRAPPLEWIRKPSASSGGKLPHSTESALARQRRFILGASPSKCVQQFVRGFAQHLSYCHVRRLGPSRKPIARPLRSLKGSDLRPRAQVTRARTAPGRGGGRRLCDVPFQRLRQRRVIASPSIGSARSEVRKRRRRRPAQLRQHRPQFRKAAAFAIRSRSSAGTPRPAAGCRSGAGDSTHLTSPFSNARQPVGTATCGFRFDGRKASHL